MRARDLRRHAADTQALMPLTPGYGETPLPQDELTAPTRGVVEILDKPITKAAVYDLEQGVQDQVSEELLAAAIEGSLQIDELLNDHFVRDLHMRLYGDIWIWAGRWRQREVNIGITTHAEKVRVHPFTDGNGRTTRLLADLVFIAAQDRAEWQYDWDVDKQNYIKLLQGFDAHRNADQLAAFIGVQSAPTLFAWLKPAQRLASVSPSTSD